MTVIFVDTSALYALVDRRDAAHDRARSFYETHRPKFLTTDFVFAETMSLITKRLDKPTAVSFGEGVRASPRIRFEEATSEVREHAWALFSSRTDKGYDLIDCISFATMAALGVDAAFSFDRHFAQHGLTLLPDVG